jgi:hypothetical protein
MNGSISLHFGYAPARGIRASRRRQPDRHATLSHAALLAFHRPPRFLFSRQSAFSRRGIPIHCARSYDGITVITAAAKDETTSAPLPVLLETRVRGFAPKNATAIGLESSVSSTLRWGSWQICDGTASDRLVGLDYFGARYFSRAQGRFTSTDPLNIANLQQLHAEQFHSVWDLVSWVLR